MKKGEPLLTTNARKESDAGCELPRTPLLETVRKGSRVASGASFMAPRATKQSFFDPFHLLLRLQFGTDSGLFGQVQSLYSRKPGYRCWGFSEAQKEKRAQRASY